MRSVEEPLAETCRIGYVVKRYPRFSETFVVNEILAHERAGLDIEIFALGPVEETHFQQIIGQVRAPVRRLSHRLRNPDGLWQRIREAAECLPAFWPAMHETDGLEADELSQAIELALQARALGISHLHAHFATTATTVARKAAAFAGLSYSFTAHAKDIYFDYATPQHVARKLRDAAFSVTVSDYNQRTLRSAYGSAADRLFRLYNGVDLRRFPLSARQDVAPRILAVGRLVRKKGFHVLIDALALMNERRIAFDCVLVGDGEERASLQAQADAAGLGERLTMPGPLSQDVVIEQMRQSTLLAMPCVISDDGNRDGLPTVLVEAMALGTPVVSTEVAGIPELVRHEENGLCVPPDDPHALAHAMASLLDDPALRRRLAFAARCRIERDFDIDVNTRQMRESFSAAIASHRGVAR
ncbi:MAG: glycosyltransferase family 4 protein [Burkholderiaceae bacterium]